MTRTVVNTQTGLANITDDYSIIPLCLYASTKTEKHTKVHLTTLSTLPAMFNALLTCTLSLHPHFLKSFQLLHSSWAYYSFLNIIPRTSLFKLFQPDHLHPSEVECLLRLTQSLYH